MTVKYRLFALIASMMVVLAALACEEEKEPIVFSDLNWTSRPGAEQNRPVHRGRGLRLSH